MDPRGEQHLSNAPTLTPPPARPCAACREAIESDPAVAEDTPRDWGPVLSESDTGGLGSFGEPNGQSADPIDDGPPSDRRRELVRRALDAWKKQLVDLGGRNNLLYYRHLKVGTLDLTACEPVHLQTLLEAKAGRQTWRRGTFAGSTAGRVSDRRRATRNH